MIPYGRQSIDEEDVNAVIEVLRSDFLTTGPKVNEFEQSFARYVGAKYAVAVSSGTAALHLSCLSLGLEPGDEVICTPMTFAASSNSVLYCGAKPVFVDIDDQGLMDPTLIKARITEKTKAIMPVHYAGSVCDMNKLRGIAKQHNLSIIEDGCHALGAERNGHKVGSCHDSDLCTFSFHPVKHVTTGEGGMITTNDPVLYRKLLSLRSHGITKSEDEYMSATHGPWYYEMQALGFNYRITDFQCALGVSQLAKIGRFLQRRRAIAKRYDDAIQDIIGVESLAVPADVLHAYHLYVIKVKDAQTRSDLFNYLKERSILCQVHYVPVHLQPYYRTKLNHKEGDFPIAESFYERIISIPIYPDLSEDNQEMVIRAIGEYFE